MKQNHIQLYLSLSICIVLAGCTTGLVEAFVPEDERFVALCFNKPDLGIPVILTRAEETVEQSPIPLPEGTTIRIGAYFRGNSGEQVSPVSFSTAAPTFEATYVVKNDGSLALCRVDDTGKQTTGEVEDMVVRGGVYDFYAVSPARKPVKDSDGIYKIKDIPHKEDVMTSFVCDVEVSQSARKVTLGTFSRKCAQVIFNVAPSRENVLPFSRLQANRLKISKVSSSGATLIAGVGTGIIPTGGDAGNTAQIVFGVEEFEPVESEADNIGLNKTKGVLLPKNTEPFDVEIDVQRDDEQATLKATIDRSISFDAGKQYVFTLEVKNNESRLQMKILDWIPYSFTDVNVGAPDKPYPDPDINVGIGTSFTVASWKEISWSGNGDVGGEVKDNK